jgi:hypothetical protein
VPVQLLEVVDGAVDGHAPGVALEAQLQAREPSISYWYRNAWIAIN